MKKCLAAILLSFLAFVPSSAVLLNRHRHGLRVGFYDRKCPQAEVIVSSIISEEFVKNPGIAANILRIFFHDCFVTGCDGSVLLDWTPSGEAVEKMAAANGEGVEGLKGLKVIDRIKERVEEQCPETVSCADIVAMAARDAVVESGLPFHAVEGGRRDSPSSRASDVFRGLPFPTMAVDDMLKLYASKGLSLEDLVVLAGAHSIGHVHCKMFDHRLHLNFSHTRVPLIQPPAYARFLRTKCPAPTLASLRARDSALVPFDPHTPFTLDTAFYRSLLSGRALLQSDQLLTSDPRTAPLVRDLASRPFTWPHKFVRAIVKMGRINVTTHAHGFRVRTNCRLPI